MTEKNVLGIQHKQTGWTDIETGENNYWNTETEGNPHAFGEKQKYLANIS